MGSPTPPRYSFAYRATWKGAGPFSSEESEHVTEGIMEAETVEGAVRAVTNKQPVLALEYGVSVEVVKLSWARAARRWAKYDKPPFIEHSVANPKAKLVIERVK